MMKTTYTPSLLLMAVMLPACSLAPHYVRPEVSFGNTWDINPTTTTEARVEAHWWERLGSPELNTFVVQALAQNNDLVASAERVAQARASLRVAGASLWPSVTAGASTGYSRPDLNAGGNSSSSANLAASYELDLFGANASTRKAAAAQL
ncbi:MAG: transporter, partial [Pseudomonas fluorescens]